MRISDWSSDVCSSDRPADRRDAGPACLAPDAVHRRGIDPDADFPVRRGQMAWIYRLARLYWAFQSRKAINVELHAHAQAATISCGAEGAWPLDRTSTRLNSRQ